MVFNTGTALLDGVVLAVVAKNEEGTYGYKLTQEVRALLDVSESALYPVLRRLQKDGALMTYDEQIGGRNRRYYRITPAGEDLLAKYREAWKAYALKISRIFEIE